MPKRKEPYDFETQLAWMEEQRKLLDSSFYPHFAYDGRWTYLRGSVGSVIFQRYEHIDVTMMTSANTSVLIDEKIDSQNRTTIFCETLSDRDRKKPGWMVKGISKSDVLLWAFSRKRPEGLKVYTFWLLPLIDWFWPRIEYFEPHTIPNTDWFTFGYSVPLSHIPKQLYFAEPELVERYKQQTLF